jgi:hypothetical protein
MSKPMRDLMNKFDEVLNESTLNRVHKYIMEHDCSVITAFRDSFVNCLHDEDDDEKRLNVRTNKNLNKNLRATLLYLGYGVTEVKGAYIENYLSDNEIEVKEDSYFVVNLKDDPDFVDNIIKMGEILCQDSVLIIKKGGENNYMVGTNNAPFPGYGKIVNLGKFKPGFENKFMTKVGGRPFTLETFGKLQVNSKYIVSEYSKPIINLL